MSEGDIFIVSGSIQKIPFLYSGSFSLIEETNANSRLASYLPLFAIRKVVELTLRISASVLFSGFLPIKRGPKSNTFSA